MKYIDVAASIKASDSKFLKRFPAFVIRWFEKIIRQDELNRILEKYKDCEGADFHRSIINEFNLSFEVEGIENLPDSGKCFFVANHPFGIIDGLTITKTVIEKYGTFKAIGNESFKFVPNLRPYIASVNPYGASSKTYVTELEKMYKSEVPITHFPAGKVSRRIRGLVKDCIWQKSFITRAVSCQRDIVPFYFYGQNSNLFYGINKFRRMLGIRTNLELILLPREMFLKRNKTIRFKIGKPIPWQTFDSSKTHVEWAQRVRAYIYNMPSQNGNQPYF